MTIRETVEKINENGEEVFVYPIEAKTEEWEKYAEEKGFAIVTNNIGHKTKYYLIYNISK